MIMAPLIWFTPLIWFAILLNAITELRQYLYVTSLKMAEVPTEGRVSNQMEVAHVLHVYSMVGYGWLGQEHRPIVNRFLMRHFHAVQLQAEVTEDRAAECA